MFFLNFKCFYFPPVSKNPQWFLLFVSVFLFFFCRSFCYWTCLKHDRTLSFWEDKNINIYIFIFVTVTTGLTTATQSRGSTVAQSKTAFTHTERSEVCCEFIRERPRGSERHTKTKTSGSGVLKLHNPSVHVQVCVCECVCVSSITTIWILFNCWRYRAAASQWRHQTTARIYTFYASNKILL